MLVENLRSWSHLELLLLPLRPAVAFLWLSVGVMLHCLNVKTFHLLSKNTYNSLLQLELYEN